MIIKIVLISIFIVITSCTKNTNEGLLKLEKLNSIANFLMLVSDDEKLITNKCNLKPDEALKLIHPLHALIDEEKIKLKIKEDDLEEMNCNKDCQCGLYSDLSKDPKKINSLLKIHVQGGKQTLIQCANQSAKWLCSSKLLQDLKSKTEQNNNAL